MSPNATFNDAFSVVKGDPEVTRVLGSPLSAYGRDHGGHREGRRNFVENEQLMDEDGKPKLRIKFNVEGPRGKGVVFAEVAEGMTRGQFVYLIFQNARTKQAFAIVDNRREIPREKLEQQLALALRTNKAVLYGSDNCQWTTKQRSEFGDASSQLNYVECTRNPTACQHIAGYPTWQIGGQMYPGFKTLEQVRELLAASQEKAVKGQQ